MWSDYLLIYNVRVGYDPTRTVDTARTDLDHTLFSARRLTRRTVAASTTPSTVPNGTRTMAHKMTPMPSPGAQQCGPAAALTIIALATIPARLPPTVQTA